jgi:hypothetical protein
MKYRKVRRDVRRGGGEWQRIEGVRMKYRKVRRDVRRG